MLVHNNFIPVVFVVDDDASVRYAIRRLLESVGLSCETFANAVEFLARVGTTTSGCIVLDVRMPGGSGLELQQKLNDLGCDLPIIFVTGYADVPVTLRAMKAGALDVITKPFEDQVLLDAVTQALERDRVRHAQRVELHGLRTRFETLTAREREVMALVLSGLLNKQAANVLGTAEKTVKVHRGQVMHKMEAASFADLVRMGERLGISRPGQ
jgi:FixJ family two-component response regulator